MTTMRPRQKGNLDLPPHMEACKSNDKTYFRYVLPDGRRRSLGKNRQEAINAALALNSALDRNPDIVANILQTTKIRYDTPTFAQAIEKFKERLLQKKLAESTRKEINIRLNNYLAEWADLRPNEILIQHIASFLNIKPSGSYIKHRILLVDIWTFFTHQGWASENIPDKTMLAIKQDKQRQRHTAESLDKIIAISPDWLQRTINLARHSVQRRGDLVLLHRDNVDMQKNTITIMQQKTQNYENKVYMEIDMHPELRQAVYDCLNTRLAFICPYLLHYKPYRITQQIRDSKPHHLCLTEDIVTKTFAAYRDKSGVYDHLEKNQRPSFHDIRALGMYELEKKYGKEYANALAGHASMKMTDHYLAGHEAIKPKKVSYR